jgi:hypothetical protein
MQQGKSIEGTRAAALRFVVKNVKVYGLKDCQIEKAE